NNVGDAGMEHVATLPNLKRLILRGTKISNDGANSLSRLGQLRYFSLEATSVTDVGMPAIGRMKELRELGLPRTITDDGLLHLQSLTNLRLVHSGPPVTKEGAGALMTKLPEGRGGGWAHC